MRTARVVREDGSVIDGLYARGATRRRSSQSYVSGLSIATACSPVGMRATRAARLATLETFRPPEVFPLRLLSPCSESSISPTFVDGLEVLGDHSMTTGAPAQLVHAADDLPTA